MKVQDLAFRVQSSRVTIRDPDLAARLLNEPPLLGALALEHGGTRRLALCEGVCGCECVSVRVCAGVSV